MLTWIFPSLNDVSGESQITFLIDFASQADKTNWWTSQGGAKHAAPEIHRNRQRPNTESWPEAHIL